MEIRVNWHPQVATKFPNLAVCIGLIGNVHNEQENEILRKLKRDVYEEVRVKYNIETLKDNPTVRAYRDSYWKLGTDPTKTRPSGEALLRRVLHRTNYRISPRSWTLTIWLHSKRSFQ